MAAQTMSAATLTRSAGAHPDPTRPADAIARGPADTDGEPTPLAWRDRAHRQARRYRRSLPARPQSDVRDGRLEPAVDTAAPASDRYAAASEGPR
jgi:hypothetical protein